MQNKINILCGTTASGKTKYAVELAIKLGAEIINADSMQIYKELPIITAQPTEAEMQGVPHHLYGVVSCLNNITVAQWIDLAVDKIKEIQGRNKTPILVGGTGMYLKSLIYGLSFIPKIPSELKLQVQSISEPYEALLREDPATAKQLNPNDRQRVCRALEVYIATKKPLIEWQQQKKVPHFPRDDFYLILLAHPRELVYKNINQRFLDMLDQGALQEAQHVLEQYPDATLPKAHGLPELISHLKGEITLQEAIAQSQQNVRNYAKRQTTWFKHQLDFNEVIQPL